MGNKNPTSGSTKNFKIGLRSKAKAKYACLASFIVTAKWNYYVVQSATIKYAKVLN